MNPQESIILDYTLHDLYNIEAMSKETIVLVKTYNVFNQLSTLQKPYPDFIKTPATLELDSNSRLAITVPLDWVSHLPHVTNPDVHYNLLSERGLAHSGLPTPKTTVIDTQLTPDRPFTKSETHEEATRMKQPIREYTLPFILKVPHVASIGQGTFIIRTESERAAAKRCIPIHGQKDAARPNAVKRTPEPLRCGDAGDGRRRNSGNCNHRCAIWPINFQLLYEVGV